MKKRYVLLLLLLTLIIFVIQKKDVKMKKELKDYDSKEILKSGIIDELYYNKQLLSNRILFDSYFELNKFIMNTIEIKDSFLYLNLANYEPEWYIYKAIYYENKKEEEIINPFIRLDLTAADEKIGYENADEQLLYGGTRISYYTEMIFYPLKGEYKDITFKKYHYESELYPYDNVIYVSAGENKICELYYYSVFKISKEYFQYLFLENMILLIK